MQHSTKSSMLFAHTLRLIRKQAGMTQKDAAALLFISRQQYCHFENGQRVPSLELLIRMATLFKKSPLELIIPLIPMEVAQENPETAFYLKNGMFTYPGARLVYDSNLPSVSPEAKHTVNIYHHAPDAHPELR